jgi:hypothetical protein
MLAHDISDEGATTYASRRHNLPLQCSAALHSIFLLKSSGDTTGRIGIKRPASVSTKYGILSTAL